MAQIEVPFCEVKPGEKFISHRTKRYFGGIKIRDTRVLDGVLRTAVILTDHVGEPAHDAGTLIFFGGNETVMVER